ncbi:hypothetical protein E8E13_009361 [Curvularia kusanoi]|uniref:Uncharacterized protein n=1 Tax=Curvularia kusanoi TaxID=90978 RepID=A0A9P4TEH7_CURKU|nr:hypothetical protein E8E13_009361 [Curvularia kusanoi]
MCRYWAKLHTCKHVSNWRHIELCHPGFITNTVCKDINDVEPDTRKSYFPCYFCIKNEAHSEAQEKLAQQQAAAAAAEAAREQAYKVRIEHEKRAREERVRREAREKAEREKAAELQKKAEMELEREKARKDGGLWTLAESNSGKKRRGKGFVPPSPTSPLFVMGTSRKDASKENGKITRTEGDKSANVSGRAGVWGPPKKILSRKEGTGNLLGNRSNGLVDVNGRK